MMLKLVEGLQPLPSLSAVWLIWVGFLHGIKKNKGNRPVRKYWGPVWGNILWLFAKEFTFLIIVASLSLPVAWFIMDKCCRILLTDTDESVELFTIISYTFIVHINSRLTIP